MKTNLLAQQDALQKEAQRILQESRIVDFLSEYGTVNIGGSFRTGLMVWRDLDIGVTPKPSEDKYWELTRRLLNTQYVNQVSLQNNSSKPNPNIPDGYYIGVKYGHSGIVWKIDIWLVDELPHIDYDQNTVEKLTPEKKLVILEIKNQIYENPTYRKSVFSVDIYNAVLDNGVKDFEEFNIYLQSIGKTLKKNPTL